MRLYNTGNLVVQVNNDVTLVSTASASCHWQDFDAFACRAFGRICDNVFIDTELEECRIWPSSLSLLDIMHTIQYIPQSNWRSTIVLQYLKRNTKSVT